ncbi:MAG: type II toxin-antitoxin system HicB family antitoxin [Candidatus Bathyarchaeota archaeon]|nr:type II toxin-antitoxin system HicB family antitoxin [Candidatus Termitimicrobium sp.]
MTNEEVSEDTFSTNVRIPENLHKEVKIDAINTSMTLNRWAAKAFRFYLYFKGNLSFAENSKASEKITALSCLQVARNDLVKQGFSEKSLAELDQVIQAVKEFLA